MANPKVQIRFPSELKFSAREKEALRKAFKADVISVLKRRKGAPPPFPETNTGGTAPAKRRPAKKAAKKTSKKK